MAIVEEKPLTFEPVLSGQKQKPILNEFYDTDHHFVNVNFTRFNVIMGCYGATDLVKINVKEPTHMFFFFNYMNPHPEQNYDDVIKWKHFRVAGLLCGQRALTRTFIVLFDLRLNKRMSKDKKLDWRLMRSSMNLPVISASVEERIRQYQTD